MRILKKILLISALVLLIIAAAGYLFFPSQIHVERSTTINQSPAVVYDYVSNLKNWNDWSPWYKEDSISTYIYSGTEKGKGSIVKWESEDKDIGRGVLTIAEAIPDSIIMLDLNFMENGVAKGTYLLSHKGDGTLFTWSIDFEAGANPLMRIMGSFMDGMIGKDFEKGLSNLKSQLEKPI